MSSSRAEYFRRKNLRAQRRIRRKNMLRRDWPALVFFLVILLFFSFRVLENGQARRLVKTGEIQSRTEICEDITRHSATAHGPYFYRIQLSDGTRLSTIYGGNFDTSRMGYETLKEQLSRECTFRYVAVNTLGFRTNYLISASNEDWSVGSEDEAQSCLEERMRVYALVMALSLVALVLVCSPPVGQNRPAQRCERRRRKRKG